MESPTFQPFPVSAFNQAGDEFVFTLTKRFSLRCWYGMV